MKEKKGENQGWRDREIYERGEDGESEVPRKRGLTVWGQEREREGKW